MKKDELFLEGEYVPWDSTFSASGSIHQDNANQHSLSNEQEFFNSKLASPLVLSEHCIGALKIAFLFKKRSILGIEVESREQLKEVMNVVLPAQFYIINLIFCKNQMFLSTHIRLSTKKILYLS